MPLPTDNEVQRVQQVDRLDQAVERMRQENRDQRLREFSEHIGKRIMPETPDQRVQQLTPEQRFNEWWLKKAPPFHNHSNEHSVAQAAWMAAEQAARQEERDTWKPIIDHLIRVGELCDGKGGPLVSTQGQGMDGFSALAEYRDLSKRAATIRSKQ